METGKSLYQRLGGYDAIAAVCNDLLPRLVSDPLLGRFWQHRAADSIAREKQSLINFLCASSGGPMYYPGRDMKLSHKGMSISDADWQAFLGHLNATLATFEVPAAERTECSPSSTAPNPTSSKSDPSNHQPQPEDPLHQQNERADDDDLQ
jgi:hemoglobin